jgi:hypothetical protein
VHINCTVQDLHANPGKKVKALLVADYNTRKLMEAERVFWVIGGKVEGVMTARPKWAFLEVNLKVYQFGRNKSVPPLRLIPFVMSLERLPRHLLGW